MSDLKAQTVPRPEGNVPNFLQSSNFWTAAFLAIGGLFVGFPQEVGALFVSQLFALLGTGKLLHEYFKTRPVVAAGEAVNRSNWWNYINTIVVSIIPMLPGEFVDQLQNVATSIINGNWQGVLVALFSLATIAYNLYQSKNKTPDTANAT